MTQPRYRVNVDFKKKTFNFTEKQVKILDCLLDLDTKVVFLTGPAGTSKSYLAVYAALHSLDAENQIIYVRSCIESASRSLGFLPGLAQEKFEPYMMPLMDKADEIVTPSYLRTLTENQKLVCTPVNFLRGASWKNKIVIIDEAQNLDRKELTTVLTRVGENTKVFVLGDASQSDINGKSGLSDFVRAFDTPESKEHGIHCFEFGKEDIVRSEILKYIVERIETIPKPK